MKLDQRLDDGQAEAGSLLLGDKLIVHLAERLEQFRDMFLGDADAIVGDFDPAPARPTLDADLHPAAFIVELDRIRQKVEQHLLQAAPVGEDFPRIARTAPGDGDLA